MYLRKYILALTIFVASAVSAFADYYKPVLSYPYNLFMDVDTTGGFSFAPVINAQTMEPFQFAFATNHTNDPGSIEGGLYSPDWVKNAMNSYSGIFGSGSSSFLVFTTYQLVEQDTSWMPPYIPAAPFEVGEPPPWDPAGDWTPVPMVLDSGGSDVTPVNLSSPLSDAAVAAARGPVVVMDTTDVDVTVPEPSTIELAIFGLGAFGVGAYRRFVAPRRRAI